jgi:2-oxo-hept-3-ene-1,7-dioate hydratase
MRSRIVLEPQRIAQLAQRLDEAERTKQLTRMFTLEHPDLAIEDAYAIQRAWTKLKLARGLTVKGHKIGLTSKAMQSAVGIDEPDYGVLFDDMFYSDGAVIPSERYHAARIEVELAFILDKSLKGPDCSIFDVLDATRYVTPALEILETRMHRIDPETKATRKVADTISDNAANAALVLGGRPIGPREADLRWISALLFRNGQIEETGVAAGVLNHPAHGVAWLVNRLARHDEGLAAGEVVLAGSFTRPVDVRKGDTFHADYGPFGSISCHFA